MKHIIFLSISLFFISLANGQTVVPDSLINYIGKTVTVCSHVADTYVTKKAKKTTFLDFEHGYPNQTFIAVIFEEDLGQFTYEPSEYLNGKNVCITGMVITYKGKPEIIVHSEDQLKVEKEAH